MRTRWAAILLLAGSVTADGLAQGAPPAATDRREVETEADRRQQLRTRAGYPSGDSRLQVRGGEISVTFAPLPASGEAFRGLMAANPGEVVEWTGSFATKLTTEVDLDFGGSVLRAENQRRGFPGAYTLWLKRTASGWSLVINRSVDIWGTDYDPSADVAEVPLHYSTVAESDEPLRVRLSVADGVLALRLSWGSHRWSTGARSAA